MGADGVPREQAELAEILVVRFEPRVTRVMRPDRGSALARGTDVDCGPSRQHRPSD